MRMNHTKISANRPVHAFAVDNPLTVFHQLPHHFRCDNVPVQVGEESQGDYLFYETGDFDVMKTSTISLKGTVIQCTVELPYIVLTPKKPEDPSRQWHVEG